MSTRTPPGATDSRQQDDKVKTKTPLTLTTEDQERARRLDEEISGRLYELALILQRGTGTDEEASSITFRRVLGKHAKKPLADSESSKDLGTSRISPDHWYYYPDGIEIVYGNGERGCHDHRAEFSYPC